MNMGKTTATIATIQKTRSLLLLASLVLCACGGSVAGDSIPIVITATNTTTAAENTAERIDSGTGDRYNPEIAINSNGNAVAVWEQFDGNNYSIWANRFDGTHWGTAEQINTKAQLASLPQVVINSDDTAVAVWEQPDGVHSSIWANSFDGSHWGTAERLDSTLKKADDLQIAIVSSNNVSVVWHQFDGTNHSIWTNHHDGNSWGTAQQIDSGTGAAEYPQIATDGRGHAIAVWSQFDDAGNNTLWANDYDGSDWWNAWQIGDRSTTSACYPKVAMDKNDHVIVVRSCIGDGILVNEFIKGRWTKKWIDSGSGGAPIDQQISMNSDHAIVVWRQYGDTSFSIRGISLDDQSIWEWVNVTLDTGLALGPQVVIDSAGNALAVWYQSDKRGLHNRIWSNRFNGDFWGNPEQVDVGTGTSPSYKPQVAANSSGRAMVVWYQTNGTKSSVWARQLPVVSSATSYGAQAKAVRGATPKEFDKIQMFNLNSNRTLPMTEWVE